MAITTEQQLTSQLKANVKHKILLIHWGKSGGGPKFAFEFARGLSLHPDVDLTVSVPKKVDNFKNWEGLHADKIYVSTYRTKIQVFLLVPKAIYFAIKLRRHIIRTETKVVFSPMFSLWHSPLSYVFLPRDVVYIASVHDASPHYGEENLLIKMAQNLDRRRATFLATYSKHVSDQLLLTTSTPQFKLAHGLEGPKLSYPRKDFLQSESLVVGFFGRLLPYKGLPLFEEMILQLNQENSPTRGRILGSGDFRLNDPKSKTFIELDVKWANDDDIEQFFKSIDLLVLPYTESSQSGVLSLSWSYGVPVVVTPTGGLSEQVSQTGAGLVTREVNAGSLTESVLMIWQNPKLYASLSALALSSSEGELGWESVCDQLLYFIENASTDLRNDWTE